MGTALEVLGLALPYSSGIPAAYPGLSFALHGRIYPYVSPEKAQECLKAAKFLKNLMELDLKPKCV